MLTPSSLLVLFAPRFLRWPLSALQSLRRDFPHLRIHGLVTGGANTVRLVKQSGLAEDVIDVVAQEHEWLAAEGAESQLRQWEEKLKPGALSRIVLSDRHLSRWTVDAIVPATPLSRASRKPQLVNRYLVGLLKTLDEFIERKHVKAMFAYAVAGAPAMAMAELANLRQLPLFVLTTARFDGLQTIDKGNYALEGLSRAAALYRAALADGDLVASTMDRARQHLLGFRASPAEPDYQSNQRPQLDAALSFSAIVDATRQLLKTASRSSARNLRKPTRWSEWSVRASRPLRARIAKHYLESIEVSKLQGRFAYFPLHFDPEASTMVFAPMLANQPQVVEAIVKALPPDMSLIVKEHPAMDGVRPIGFYKRIQRLPRVRLVSAAVSSFELMARCELTCSITGTAAWEAVLLRKPALVLGAFPFSVIEEGLVTCRNISMLPHDIARALRMKPADDRTLLTYIAAVYATSFRFPSSIYWTQVTSQMVAENPRVIDNMTTQLRDRLREEGLDGDRAKDPKAAPPVNNDFAGSSVSTH